MIVIPRSRRRSSKPAPEVILPSPDEIRSMTAAIRQTWTPRERCRRANITGFMEVEPMALQPRRKGFWGD